MSSDRALIEAQGLRRDFGALRAVDGVDLAVPRGQILGLLGPNGAGKTSTLRMICGTLAPTAGRITIAGTDLLESPRGAKRALGYLPEQPPVYPDMTVTEYLHFCAGLRGLRRRARQRAPADVIERCSIGDVRDRLIGQLSKGYRQRVGIAQAILHDPPAIVLDEPTVGLDPIQVRGIRELIAGLAPEHAVILSTHILPEVQTLCSHVQIMHRGRIAWADSLAAFDRHGETEQVTVTLARPDPSPASLPGVRDCVHIGERRFRLTLDPASTSVERIATALVDNGSGLQELSPERPSLEQLFVQVTTGERSEAAAETRA